MMVGALMFALSYLTLVVAPNVWVIYIGRLPTRPTTTFSLTPSRFATGVCTGVCSIVCPVYVAETATPQLRGLLGSCVQLMVGG
jgi:MFS family permease